MRNVARSLLASLSAVALSFGLGITALAAADDAVEEVVDVTDFGADPSGATDSTPAVAAAIAHAKEINAPTRLYFPKGEYNFYPDKAPERELYTSNTVGTLQNVRMKKLPILIEDMHDVTIDGGGSAFIFHGIETAFASIRSTNVTFENFSADYYAPRVVEATVIDAGLDNSGNAYRVVATSDTIDYEIEGHRIHWLGEKSPYTGERYWDGYDNQPGRQSYGQLLNTATGHAERFGGQGTLFTGVTAADEVAPGRIKLTYSDRDAPTDLGVMYQFRDIERDTPGAFIWESKNTTLSNLNIHYLQNFGILSQMTDTVTVDGVKFHAGQGNWRSTTNFADLLHFSGVKGKVTITNSYFTNPQDDPINIHGTYLRVVDRPAPNQVTLRYMHDETAGFQQYFVGDKVELVDDKTMLPLASGPVTVTDVSGPSGNSDESLRRTTITFSGDLPESVVGGGGYVAENITYTPEVLIQNNEFTNAPTRGILVTTRKPVRILDNHFDNMNMASIFISDDAYQWYESGHVEDVLIKGNTFDRPSTSYPVIFFEPTNRERVANKTVHSNVTVTENIFNVAGSAIVGGKSVSNLRITDNVIQRSPADLNLDLDVATTSLSPGEHTQAKATGSAAQYTQPLYDLAESLDVTVADNSYDNGLNARISTVRMDAGEIHVSNDRAVVNENNQLPRVGEIGYLSTNPEVATIDSHGAVTAKSVGKTQIIAFATSDVAAHESAPVTVTVSGEAIDPVAEDLTITSVPTSALAPGDSVSLNATSGGQNADVTWSVKDLSGSGVAAIDADGTLSGEAPGVAQIDARTSSGSRASAVIAVNAEAGTMLDPRWQIHNPDEDARLEVTDSGELVMTPAGDGSMWANDSEARTAGNVVVGDGLALPVGESATVRMAGKTQEGWEEAGLGLFVDHDNYLTIQRKNNNSPASLNMVTEAGGQADESRKIASPTEDPIWLRITRTDENRYQGSYSIDGKSFTDLGSEVSNDAIAGGEVAFVVATKAASSKDHPFVFSELQVAGQHVPFARENAAPTATDLRISQGAGSLKASWNFADPDSDEESGTVVAWLVGGEVVGTGSELDIDASLVGSQVSAIVVPRDEAGGTGDPVASDSIEVSERAQSQSDAELASIGVAGATLDGDVLRTPFSGKSVQLTPRPRAAGATVGLSVAGEQISADDEGTFTVPLDGDRTAVTVTVASADGSQTTTRELTVRHYPDSRADLTDIAGPAGVWSGFDPNAHFSLQFLGDSVTDMCLAPTPASPHAALRVVVNGNEIEPTDGIYPHRVVEGLNTVDIWTLAPDGTSSSHYRLSAISDGPRGEAEGCATEGGSGGDDEAEGTANAEGSESADGADEADGTDDADGSDGTDSTGGTDETSGQPGETGAAAAKGSEATTDPSTPDSGQGAETVESGTANAAKASSASDTGLAHTGFAPAGLVAAGIALALGSALLWRRRTIVD